MLSVIIPTLNERDNIVPLFRRLGKALEHAGTEHEVILVDDSQDGTIEEALSCPGRLKLRVIKRTDDSGLSSAIFRGIGESCGDIIMVMDADLSHPPEIIPRLLKESANSNLVIASRYVNGGGIEDWSLLRRMASLVGAFLARGATRVRDPLSGCFLLKRESLSGIRSRPMGFKASLDIIAHTRGRISEVPYTFRNRRLGKSKMGVRTVLCYLVQLFRLYLGTLSRGKAQISK